MKMRLTAVLAALLFAASASPGWAQIQTGEITGRVDVEDVLDRLFSSFCIGK